VAITSNRPQTTRHTIRGIVHRENFQIILVDTPGLHRPRTLLGQRLNDLVKDTYSEVDVIGLCIPADEKIGPGDRWIRRADPDDRAEHHAGGRRDQNRQGVEGQGRRSTARGERARWGRTPRSFRFGDHGREPRRLDRCARSQAAARPGVLPRRRAHDEPEEVLMAELIREAALEGVRDELPHSLAVVIEEVSPREGRDDLNPLVDVHAVLYVERDSQKGHRDRQGRARLREVGTAARTQIETLLGTKVYLDLRVKIAKNWQRDPKQLGRLGF